MIFNDLIPYLPLLLRGTLTTLIVWIFASFMSLGLGIILGILNSYRVRQWLIGPIISSYVVVMKGIPLYVQLLISYFIIPKLLGINLSPILVATLTLGLCSAAYIAEIVRAGINALPIGQWEACTVLGYSSLNALRLVILPQVVRNSLPTFIGELDQIIKSTAVFSTIGVMELTKTAMNIVSRELNPIPMYLFIAGVYLIISIVINVIGKKIEQRKLYGFR